LFTFAVPKKWPGLMTHIKEGALVLTDRTTRPDILGFKNRLGFDVFILAIILKSAEFARVLLKFLASCIPTGHKTPIEGHWTPVAGRCPVGWPDGMVGRPIMPLFPKSGQDIRNSAENSVAKCRFRTASRLCFWKDPSRLLFLLILAETA
jgi:hypothetical protein